MLYILKMAHQKELSVVQREMIVHLSKQGKTIRNIGSQLNISKSSVHFTLKRLKETGTTSNRPGRGTFFTVIYRVVFIFILRFYLFRLGFDLNQG